MKKLSLFDKIIYVLNIIVALALLLSYVLPYVEPKNFAALSVISLTVPILIIINIVFLLYWVFKFKRQLLLSGIILVIGFKYVGSLYQFSKEKSITTSKEMSVVSYNVRLFNRYDWIQDEEIPKKLTGIVKLMNADVFCAQEYYEHKDAKLDFYKYSYVKIKDKKSKTGLAIFTNSRIINKGSIEFPNTSNNAIYADIKKGNDTIRVYNVHLESLRINPDVDELKEADSEQLMKHMGKAFIQQQSQAEILTDHMKLCKHRKMVMGDFNNSPYSYVYKQIKGDMVDAFQEAGQGFGKTFDFKLFPMRIDFILADPSMVVNAFKNYSNKYSDHFPIYARFDLNR